MINVSKDIKRVRIEAGLSQEALCKELGVSRATICNYEKRGICPSVYRFEDILNICGYELQIVKVK